MATKKTTQQQQQQTRGNGPEGREEGKGEGGERGEEGGEEEGKLLMGRDGQDQRFYKRSSRPQKIMVSLRGFYR